MKKNDSLKDFHVGEMIRKVAHQKQISPKQIVSVLDGRYQENADKIFHCDDMCTLDVGHISYLLEHNLLEDISAEYLSHIPYEAPKHSHKLFILTLHLPSLRFTLNRYAGRSSILDNIDVGSYLKALAHQNGWSHKFLAGKLGCNESLISFYYAHPRMKIKRMIELSLALNHNFVAELFLSQMYIPPSLKQFDECAIIITDQDVQIFNPKDGEVMFDYILKVKEKNKET